MKRLEIKYSLKAIDVLVSLARYNFVNRTVHNRNLKILDFGCGSGYGTRALQEHFTDVTAFDIYPDDYSPSDIKVETDLIKLKQSRFDVVTCFEVIEHLHEKEQQRLMGDLADLLTDFGTLYISTVRKLDPPPTENRQKEHVKELTFEELLIICLSKFHNVYTFGQIDQSITTFYQENAYHYVFICTHKK